VATTPPPARSNSASTEAGSYSQDLEQRARQQLLNAQSQQPAAQEQQAAQSAANAASTIDPLRDPNIDRVHSQAYGTFVQVEPGQGGQARMKNKQDRLRALTDLYRADRMTPAEYHQRRAAILAEKEQQ
jgi:hypothetical protein